MNRFKMAGIGLVVSAGQFPTFQEWIQIIGVVSTLIGIIQEVLKQWEVKKKEDHRVTELLAKIKDLEEE